MAEPIPLEVINYPTDVVQSFGDAAKIDRQLGEPGASERAPTSSPSNSSSYPRSDYYVYKDKGEDGATYPIPQTKNLFGANIDVISTLDEVIFEKFGDGSMQNAIAYITPWKRGGVSSKSSPSVPSEALYREDFLGDLNNRLYSESFTGQDLNFNLGASEFASDLDFNNSPVWDPENSEWYTTDVGLDFDTNFNIDTKGKTGGNAQDQEPRQKKLASQIPIGLRQGLLTGAQLANSYFSKDNSQVGKYIETGLNLAGRATDTPSGPVYIGNPAGVINQGLNLATMFGFNIPGRGLTTSIPPNLQSSSPKVIGAQQEAPEGMWQFLFNPNELALNVGPKYKATETWGVLDDANGGQPLHFTNLVNPKLKFSRVLLNGYVFGKRVENLEQGLIDLFMKNPSGNTSHGPQVLEFVWGQRCFGPCVIKDITINEKQWDNGLLVNATVSFTLEKVPEWSINDGQVSVYDASSLDSIISPVQTSSESPNTAPNTAPTDEDSKPSSEREPVKTTDSKKCGVLKTGIDNVSQLVRNGDYYKKRVLDFGKAEFLGSSFFGEPGMDPDIGISKMSSQYVNWNSRTNVGGMIPAGTSGCGIPSLNKEKEKINRLPDYVGAGASRAQNSKKMRDAVALIGKYQKCIKERDVILKKKYKEDCSSGGPQSIDPPGT